MKECKKFKKDSVAFLCGEIQKEEGKLLESHLDVCFRCRKEFEELKLVIKGAELFNTDINEAIISINWESLPAKISEKIQKEKADLSPRSWWRGFWESLSLLKLKPLYAGLIAGILIGSLATLLILRFPYFKPDKGSKFSVSQDFLERAEIEMARRETLDYLKKSQYLLLDFVQSSPGISSGFWQSDYAAQKAKDLLSQKKYINRQLDRIQMAKAKAICDQIELLFYELAQIGGQVSTENLERIQKLIEEKQIFLKIKLVSKELEDSEV